MSLTYEQTVAAIEAMESKGWRLGLDRMQEFCRRAGLQDALGGPVGPQFIHVAGTNGKGSTTGFVQSLLVSAGFRTGAFFSPYVVDYRERIQLNRELISRDDLVQIAELLWPVSDSLEETEFGGLTKFEFETAMGFAFWKQKHCQWVALEVGLGGRLDSTNIVTPRCAVITSIGLDHTAILGHTIPAIAREKAGIVKPGLPTVIGRLPEAAIHVVEEVCRDRNSVLWKLGDQILLRETESGYWVDTPAGSYGPLKPSLRGARQPNNMAIAIAALDAAGLSIGNDAALLGVASASAPGRFEIGEWNGCTILLDGAHNPEAAATLRESIGLQYPGTRFHLVTSMLSGHDPKEFYAPIADVVGSVTVAPLNVPRSYTAAELLPILNSVFTDVSLADSLEDALRLAHRNVRGNDAILVTGSNYLVGAALNAINADRKYTREPPVECPTASG